MARKTNAKLSARTADKYVLYTESVQSPENEIGFFTRVFRKENGRPPTILREDFCGTAAISCKWVEGAPHNIAIGVDLDPEPLAWCRQHRAPSLSAEQCARLRLLQANVLSVKTAPVDVIAALNFSFCVFKERKTLMHYLRRCHQALHDNGLMVMDLYGGPESQQPAEEKTSHRGFTYVWDQADYNPITNEALNHIHFIFHDGTRMMKAFTYDWRLWTLGELSEAMKEAGFGETRVYWEGTDGTGEGNGVFRHRKRVDQEEAWIAYIVGIK